MAVGRREFLTAPWRVLSSRAGRITIDSARCTLCGACADRCPEGALALAGAPYALQILFDTTRCTACEACLICPEQALHLELLEERPTQGTPTILVEDTMLRCSRCGGEVGPARLIAKILKSPQELLCPTCRIMRASGMRA